MKQFSNVDLNKLKFGWLPKAPLHAFGFKTRSSRVFHISASQLQEKMVIIIIVRG